MASFLLLVRFPTVAYGASIAVTTTDDELNSDGDCSLREDIQAVNTDTAVDACPAGSGLTHARIRHSLQPDTRDSEH